MCDWSLLTQYVYLGEGKQEPYAELDAMLFRIREYGTLRLQIAFARSTQLWNTRNDAERNKVLEYFRVVEGFDAGSLWLALEILKHANNAEVMSMVLKRKALLDIVLVYEELVNISLRISSKAAFH